jgi:hypothetical protein
MNHKMNNLVIEWKFLCVKTGQFPNLFFFLENEIPSTFVLLYVINYKNKTDK